MQPCVRAAFIVRAQELASDDATTAPPLIIAGEAGCGKSALIANWVYNRRRAAPHAHAEFVFMHVAGASRDASSVVSARVRARGVAG